MYAATYTTDLIYLHVWNQSGQTLDQEAVVPVYREIQTFILSQASIRQSGTPHFAALVQVRACVSQVDAR